MVGMPFPQGLGARPLGPVSRGVPSPHGGLRLPHHLHRVQDPDRRELLPVGRDPPVALRLRRNKRRAEYCPSDSIGSMRSMQPIAIPMGGTPGEETGG